MYRKNYGVTLWNAGYDGTMDFDYHFAFGNVWNDYDQQASHYRDHVFAYPTSNGVIDTIQWEGFREGVDDTRYVATLMEKEGSITSAKTIVSAGLSNNENMTTIRKNVINQILPAQVNRAPVLTPIGSKTIGAGSPLTFTVSANDPDGNSLTYSASNLPTNATFNPATRTFAGTPTSAQVGTVTVTFGVSDGSMSDTESAGITVTKASITVTAPNGGESWKRGTTQTISWDYKGGVGSTVKIVLLKAGTTVGTITSSTSIGSNGKGSYNWPISTTDMTGGDFNVLVQSISQPTIKDMSNRYFKIRSKIPVGD